MELAVGGGAGQLAGQRPHPGEAVPGEAGEGGLGPGGAGIAAFRNGTAEADMGSLFAAAVRTELHTRSRLAGEGEGAAPVLEGELAALRSAPSALGAVVYGGAPLDTIGVEGDKALAKRFTTLFPLPPKVA